MAADSSEELLRVAEDYGRERPGLFLCSCEIREVRSIGDDHYIFLASPEKRCPRILLVRALRDGRHRDVLPYFPVREGPDRQTVSYLIGRGLCNLAEVKELFGSLFSRYCGSYKVDELPQREGSQSRIALWVHDCLTEDFDHQTSLNRQNLHEGICVSYDFGMSFANHYYPPFYTLELGISDDSILESRIFLLGILSRYARWVVADEEIFIDQVRQSYPTTHHADRCRYYLRSYKAYFPARLYYGRFFEKLRSAPFEGERVSEIARAIEVDVAGISDWETLVRRLRETRPRRLDLRGLDLSEMNLRRADLRGADLRDADLSGAELEVADLRGADLRGANLEGTNLRNAKMESRSL